MQLQLVLLVFPPRRPFYCCDLCTSQQAGETLCKLIEASVSDVLLTCWANNFRHQQFFAALHVPTVKSTVHSISISKRK